METVRIDTSHNVALHYEVATIVDRGLAMFFDVLILFGYFIGISMVGGLFGVRGLPVWCMILIYQFPWIFYHLICEVTMDGQSIGKRARNIKVARLDGGQPSLGQYLLRWVLRFVDMLFFLGAVVILFNGKGQRLGDLAAGTTVISLKQRIGLSDTLAMDVPVEHEVTFPEATRLTDAHARLVKDVLNNTSEVRPSLMAKLAARFQQELGITSTLPPEPFLRKLLADYVFLTTKS